MVLSDSHPSPPFQKHNQGQWENSQAPPPRVNYPPNSPPTLFPSLVLENLASIHDSLMRRLLLGLLDGTSPKSFHLTSDANTFQLTHIWGQEQSHVFQFKWELTKSSPDPLAKPLSSLLFFFSCRAGKKKKRVWHPQCLVSPTILTIYCQRCHCDADCDRSGHFFILKHRLPIACRIVLSLIV